MRKISIFLFLFCISLCSLIYANPNCFQESCSDLQLPGGNSFTGYASNIVNSDSSNVYERCILPGSEFSPVVFDYDNDGSLDILITSASNLRFYTANCVLEKIYTASGSTAMPVITNFDGDDILEIVISHTLSTLEWIHWNSSLDDFSVVKEINASENGGSAAVTVANIVCSFNSEEKQCDFAEGTNMYIADFDDDIGIYKAGELPTAVVDFDSAAVQISHGLTSVRTTALGSYRMSLPSWNGNDAFWYFLNDTGDYMTETTGDISSASTAISRGFSQQGFWAAVGGARYFFGRMDYKKTNREQTIGVWDTGLSSMLYPCGTSYCTSSGNLTSNWMVADYDKDGSKEACLFIKPYLATDEATFRCWKEPFLSPSVDFQCPINISSSFVMADFYPDNATMAVATPQGILSMENSQCYYAHEIGYASLYTEEMNSSGLVLTQGAASSPFYIYSDTSGLGFVFRNPNAGSACGNGVCEDYENGFSCPADCLEPGEYECTSDDDCSTAYPYCILNTCVASSNISVTCILDTDCPFTDPFCYGGVCIKGWSSGQPAANATAQQAQVDAAFDETIGILFGTSTLFKFLVSISLIIAVMVMVASYTQSGLVIAISGLMMTIFVTVAGLMPIYVLILIIISGIGFAAFKIMFSSPGGG